MTRSGPKVQHTRKVYVRDNYGQRVLAGWITSKPSGEYIAVPYSPLDKERAYPSNNLARQYIVRTFQQRGG